jgi:hypothetical protein
MPRAVLKNGLIYPLESWPVEWRDGQEVSVESVEGEKEAEPSAGEIDHDFSDLGALCASSDSMQEERLDRALEEAKRLAKELVRRQMGLP